MRVQFVYDVARDTPQQGESFFHCAECLKERPADQSPYEWARQQVAITPTGLQVWCTRHHINIAAITVRVKE